MYRKNYYRFAVACLFALLGISCSEQMEDMGTSNGKGALVKASFTDFQVNGVSSSLEKDNKIEDMQACLFENGIMTGVYTNVQSSENEYTLKVDKMSGTLYMLANTSRFIDLNQLMESGITEEEWLATSVSADNGKAALFFTGTLNLEEQPHGQYTLPLNLKRGVARIDLYVRTTNVQIRSITLKNVMQQGFLLEQETMESPSESVLQDMVFNFDQPLQQDSLGLTYLYEQANPDLKVAVDVSMEGRSYQLEEPLPRKLKRNTIYTLTIRKDHVTEKVTLEVKAWENGGESASNPDLDSHLTINPTDSYLPEGAQVNAKGDILTLPHTASDFILAVNSDDELECRYSLGESMGIEPVESEPGKNLFRVQTRLLPPGFPSDTTVIYFHRKGLQNSYDEDQLKVVLRPNPIRLEGDLTFNKGNYTCDFRRYIDNELGRFIMPEGQKLTVICPENDPWIKIVQAEDDNQTYRVIGGWKPNDPNADGREQTATLVVRRTADGQETERYTVKRRNWGLPVTLLNGIWWCKYNAIGNSKSFDDQILCPQDPARLAGKTVQDYLKDCPQDMYLKLWNAAYGGNSGIAMKAVYKDEKWVLDGWRSNEPIHINGLDAKALSPDGYEMPSFEDYKQILGYPMTIPLSWGEYSPTIEGSNYRSRIIWETRNDIQMEGNVLGDLASFTIESLRGYGSEPLTFYGVGSQWGNDGINANNFLIANYNPTNLNGSFINGSRRLTINGAGARDTRIVRFKKSPVEYIYGTEEATD